MAPDCGLITRYEAPVTLQFNVTEPLEFVVVGFAENDEMTGALPVGTLDESYTGFICTTSKSEACRFPNW
jgi:hypothetical protein